MLFHRFLRINSVSFKDGRDFEGFLRLKIVHGIGFCPLNNGDKIFRENKIISYSIEKSAKK